MQRKPPEDQPRIIQEEEGEDRRPESVFPPHDDPASSARPAEPPPASRKTSPPRDTQYAGHPEFSQDAAVNEPIVAGDEGRHSAAQPSPAPGHGPKQGRQ